MLANIVGKSYGQIFREFEGNIDPRTAQGSGDVKYHLGADGQVRQRRPAPTIQVSLAANPSATSRPSTRSLEGIARAKQDLLEPRRRVPGAAAADARRRRVRRPGRRRRDAEPVASCAGYRTGGTIHVVVNNQVGFTTVARRRPLARCTATDVAKMVQAPIFHVNGDDPEACVRVARLAFEFRQAFNKDVVIDMVCYRRHGHNEGDDPSYTQPLMYDADRQQALGAQALHRGARSAAATSPSRRPSRRCATSSSSSSRSSAETRERRRRRP